MLLCIYLLVGVCGVFNVVFVEVDVVGELMFYGLGVGGEFMVSVVLGDVVFVV